MVCGPLSVGDPGHLFLGKSHFVGLVRHRFSFLPHRGVHTYSSSRQRRGRSGVGGGAVTSPDPETLCRSKDSLGWNRRFLLVCECFISEIIQLSS